VINVFIDANIWLSLYDFSNDDLEQFRKLSDLIDTDVRILLPFQVRDEFYRNRENKIHDVLKQFGNIATKIPNICRGYPEFIVLRDGIREVNSLHKEFIKKIEKDAKDGSLHADQIIGEIFDKIEPLQITDEIVANAKYRLNVGNPPGKDRKLGDAINWEALLYYAHQNEDIFFVSADKDYRSLIDDTSFNSYLANEWCTKKRSALFFYRTLTDFINNHVGTIELKTENEKRDSIELLRQSRSFQRTHSTIAQLNRYSSWTNDQIIELCQIAHENNQVNAILDDIDVFSFYATLLSGKENEFDDLSVGWVLEILSESGY